MTYLITDYYHHHHSLLLLQADPQKFRVDLINIARTTLSSKLLSQEKAHFGEKEEEEDEEDEEE